MTTPEEQFSRLDENETAESTQAPIDEKIQQIQSNQQQYAASNRIEKTCRLVGGAWRKFF